MGLIKSLGYVTVQATDMQRWHEFALGALGFATGTGPDPESLYLRMDERAARIRRPRSPSSLELQEGLADLQDVAGVDLDRGVDAAVVEQSSVRRPLILYIPSTVLAVQACVHL